MQTAKSKFAEVITARIVIARLAKAAVAISHAESGEIASLRSQ
jgi:hypothetical protein